MNAIIGSKLGGELGKLVEPILVILVTAAVYFSTSRTVLRSYITAKNASIPLATPKVPQKKLIRFFKFLGAIVVPLVLFSLIRITYGQDIQFANVIYSAIFFTPMFLATYRLLLSMSDSEKKALFKDAKTGYIIVHLIDTSTKFRKLRLILSGAIVAFAFSFNNLAALIVVYAAAITFPSWFFLRSLISLRTCAIFLLFWVGGTAISTGIIFLISLYSSTSPQHESEDAMSSLLLSLMPDIQRWSNRIIAIELAFLPQIIINTCLRFDYHNHLKTNDIIIEKGTSSSAPIVDKDEPKEEPRYVFVSPKLPLEFRKTYYAVSMGTWSFSCLAMMSLIPFATPPLDFWVYGGLMSTVSFIFMIIATLTVAAIRKQLRDLWNFSETVTLTKDISGQPDEAKPLIA